MAETSIEARILSVNVGLPGLLYWQGKEIRSGFSKTPLLEKDFPVRIRKWNIDGDKQADLSVHGGKDKSVYAYPEEHYSWWRQELGGHARLDAPAAFGENLTLRGLLETQVRIGDHFSLGTAELVVTQPRTPCFKLNAFYQRKDMVKRFHNSLRVGFYLTVAKEGEFSLQDSLRLIKRVEEAPTIPEIYLLYTGQSKDKEMLARALKNPFLSASWREKLERLAKQA